MVTRSLGLAGLVRLLVRAEAGHHGSVTTRKGPSWALRTFPVLSTH
jgi:hypothetical protein